VGVAFNGVPIQKSVSADGYDPLFPQAYDGHADPVKAQIDDCVGFLDGTGFYSYYSVSPCLSSSFITINSTGALCQNIALCNTDFTKYVTQGLPSTSNFVIYNNVQAIGIARDGHLILGPYKSNGATWQPCDVDFCNGAFIYGNYYYVTTFFHPYTVGCWGPSSDNIYKDVCSSQSKVCTFSAE
jgi:hypothetical protein